MFFHDVLGHAEPIARLKEALHGGRLHHALLFSGKRGVGKRTVAEALAAAILCQKRGDEACGDCEACTQSAAGTHPDFERLKREVGKRDVGIGQVRGLLDFLHRKTHAGGARVALIDESERLTNEAQNAFLKTLEEPPANTHLILVTGVIDRLLPTIRSRCAVFRFGRLDEADVRAFAARRGLDADAPLALALGSPGQAERLCSKEVRAVRDAVDEFVRFDVPPVLAARRIVDAATVAEDADDDEAGDEREKQRDALAIALRQLSFVLRDALVLADGGAREALLNDRLADVLDRGRGGFDGGRLEDAIDGCDLAIMDLQRNADPALVLVGVCAEARKGLGRS
ncbi:MAG: DNA polymerase III subunit delta' [Planctomycetes bacterium]|nr:DNA polymerase III subunit delta' [Planctomycetota bacterium]